MRINHANYLIIDLEATCCDAGSVPREEMEIIEVGAVVQDAQSFEIRSEFQTFVRPVRNPVLTDFCKTLTSIRQDDVDSALLFPEAIAAMTSWRESFEDALFCSWGNYDRNQFRADCRFHNVPYPFPDEHVNLKTEFSKSLRTRKPYGLGGALKKLGLTFAGTAHRGLDDARNIARVVREICTRTPEQ